MADQEGSQNDETPAMYTIDNVRERHVVKFNARAHDYVVKVPPLQGRFDYLQAVVHLHELFQGRSLHMIVFQMFV
jgi:hypothetical protein